MIYPLLPAWLHGWLDEAVAPIYLAGAWWLHVHGLALGALVAAATVHFTITRITDYPRGSLKLLTFRTHGWIELVEGLALMALAGLLTDAPVSVRGFLAVMGFAQAGGAFCFSDYRWPLPPS